MKLHPHISRVLTPAERKILLYLYARTTPADEEEITNVTGVKGVRPVVLRLRTLLGRYGIYVHSDYGRGYHLSQQSKTRLLK